MKKTFTFLLCLVSAAVFAQAPQGIPYQAIARNASGQAIANTAVKVRFSIRDSIATGAIKYQEIHNPTTSALGLFSVNVGMGTVVSGTFSGINWGKNAKFLQVEMDPAGGAAYTNLGTTQMMSVPYAMNAANGLPSSGIAKDDILKFDGTSWKPGKTIPTFTTKQRDELPAASKYAGFTFFNSSTKCLEYYDGTSWLSLCGSTAMVGDTAVPSDLAEVGQTVSRLTLPTNSYGGEWLGSGKDFILFYTNSYDQNCTGTLDNFTIYRYNVNSNTLTFVPMPNGLFQFYNGFLSCRKVFSTKYKDKINIITFYYNQNQTDQTFTKIYTYDNLNNSWTIKDVWSSSTITANEFYYSGNEGGFLTDSLFYYRSFNQGTSNINLNTGELSRTSNIYVPQNIYNNQYLKYYEITNEEKVAIYNYLKEVYFFNPKQNGNKITLNMANISDLGFIKSDNDNITFRISENNISKLLIYNKKYNNYKILDYFFPNGVGNLFPVGKRYFSIRTYSNGGTGCKPFEIYEIKL